jgi:hypothetical protein
LVTGKVKLFFQRVAQKYLDFTIFTGLGFRNQSYDFDLCTTGSLARFGHKNILFYFENAIAY